MQVRSSLTELCCKQYGAGNRPIKLNICGSSSTNCDVRLSRTPANHVISSPSPGWDIASPQVNSFQLEAARVNSCLQKISIRCDRVKRNLTGFTKRSDR